MAEQPLSDELLELVEQAKAARAHAYAPYSKFAVGAALRAKDGRVFTGVNVENASYGLAICAERAAVFAAATAGVRPGEIAALAVVTPGGRSPCGACRQVLHEFGDFSVALADADGAKPAVVYSVSGLLPAGFQLDL